MKVVIIFLLFYGFTWSQNYYMNVKTKTGTQSFLIQDIQKLTFSDLQLVVDVKDYNNFKQVLNTFTLIQNYPNPFNPSTTIEYLIPEAGNVEVSIYDISGQLVKELSNNIQNSGTHRVIWDSKNNYGQNVASGNYFYQVKFNQTVLTKKLMYIK
ncbi:MAG: hypothetical protein A2W11_12170 [Ignavibacteria bacterium RBG_16_35_7]|nr:MAG: hypothetical protein A2W11_12170 [Ignavibacteria bacterium RBG_16_35_7]